MSVQFFPKLSQNFIELLEDDEYYDITIEVGENPNVKIFRAHTGILCYRSSYLRRYLTSNKKNNDNVLAHIKLPKISPDTFQIILTYIYGGIFSLNENDTSDIFKVLVAADALHLNELVDYLQKWIDKIDINSKFAHLRGLYLPYKFNLLLRESQNGFSPNKFHELCDDKPNSVAFIKVKGTEEILGGYNPSIWKSSGDWGQSCSFIFSFKNKDKLDDSILSHISNMDKALNYSELCGPSFGASDLHISVDPWGNNTDYNICVQANYEKKIRDTGNEFNIEEYEVFQIIRI
ncbi:BTB/POZ protein [Rhizophagus irregularis DAOM 181602=DAOM 197198]|nr:BTB/POZ protein [Rhizophagus irregularis DAOM 181602=DAOM 197198]